MIGALLNDRYRLDAVVGQGGMGKVYRAYDLLLGRQVAVKVLSAAALGTEGRARLLREAQSAAQLNHPNIVSIYDAGEASLPGLGRPVPFIVMELVPGSSLHDRQPNSLEETLSIAGQICAALEHAHGHGIVHRDLKPENVLLSPHPGGTAKLTDFGLARSVASRLTTEGSIAGTVFYLAPELALGQEFDGRADLYALGVVLYELVTGELPFVADDPLAVISQHLHAPPVPPRARNSAIPAGLDALILGLLSKKPEDRPGSAADVRRALAGLAAGETIFEALPQAAEEFSMLDRIARGRLVAREKELGQIRGLWRRAAAGEGHVLLISGEPGIGKSRLVRELLTQVQVVGDGALLGECYAEEGAPYAPFGQILRRAFQNGVGAGLELPDFVLADLLALAPTLRLRFPGIPPNPALNPQAEQQRLFENVAAFCSAVTARGPLLLVLEDAHWADSGSLALLRHLVRRMRRQPVLIVVTYREVELDERRPFGDVLVDLNRERLATRLKLSRLDRRGTHDLLAALFAEDITPDFLEGIYRETEGNPFFVEEVCKALVESGALTFAGGQWHRPSMDRLDVPQSVRMAIQSRIRRLPEEVQEVLQMAAILGREFSFDVLAEAMGETGADEDALIGVLEAAERAQLIEEVGRGRDVTFAFAHALIPATLAEGVSTLRRRRLHRRAASAVERLHPADDETLAHHYTAAGDEERALTYSTRAARRALAAYANVEAERHYRAALELQSAASPSDSKVRGAKSQAVAGSGPERAELLAGLGHALAGQSRGEEAIATWRLGIELFTGARDQDGVARLYAHVGRLAWQADTAGALAVCREGMAAVARMGPELADTPGVARLLHETARACHFNGLSAEAAPLGRQALEMAERLGDPGLQAEALSTLAILPGKDHELAVEMLARAVEMAEAAGLLLPASRAENNLGATLAESGDFKAARAHYLRSAELGRRAGFAVGALYSRAGAANLALLQGDLYHVEQELPSLHELLDAIPGPGLEVRGALLLVEASLLRCRGALAEAAAQWQALRTELAATGNLQGLAGLTESLAEVLFEMGRDREGEAAAHEAILAAERFYGSSIAPECLLCAERARRGDVETARSFLARAREGAAARLLRAPEPFWLSRAKAHLAAAERQWPEALSAFDAAARWCERHGVRWYRARTLQEWAEAHLARGEPGDRDRAGSLLREAAAEFEAMGAPFYVEQAQRRLDAVQDKT